MAMRTATLHRTAIDSVAVSAFTIPTDQPEADGTLRWDSTTVVVAEPRAGGATGLGFTYGPEACATMLRELLVPLVEGTDAMDVPGAWLRMVRRIRNAGRPGVASMAIAAMDTALWDLKARLLDVPLAVLLGRVRDTVPVYGSGGFTTYSDGRLRDQLSDWRGRGFERVKIKIGEDDGSRVDRDLRRVELARDVIGDSIELFVDANGGYGAKQAIRVARELRELHVRWFEEPVSSDDLVGLRTVRHRGGGRRVRVRPPVLRGDVRVARGGCPPGGRVALRRDHGMDACGGRRRGARARDIGSLRPVGARAPGVRGAEPSPSGVLPRSRARGPAAVRRRPRTERRRPSSRRLASGQRA
jgi:hypothetical protein